MEINELIKLMKKKQKAYNIAREEYILAREQKIEKTKLDLLKAQLDLKEKEYTKVAKEYANLRDKRWAKESRRQEKNDEVTEESFKEVKLPNISKQDKILRIEDKSMNKQKVLEESFWDKYKKEIEESPNFKKAIEELKNKIEKAQNTTNKIEEKKEEAQEQQEPNKALPIRSFWEIYHSTCTRSCGKYSKCYQ